MRIKFHVQMTVLHLSLRELLPTKSELIELPKQQCQASDKM